MKKIREIIRFKETTNMSERKIARALNISRPVVAQYIKDFNASGLTYEETKDIPDSRFLALFGHLDCWLIVLVSQAAELSHRFAMADENAMLITKQIQLSYRWLLSKVWD